MTRGLPLANGHLRNANTSRKSNWLVRALAAAVAIGCLTSVASPALADDLDDQKDIIQGQLDANGAAVDGAQSALDSATAAVMASRQALADAQAVLAKAQSDRDAAAVVDQQMATELAAAEQELSAAQDRVANGKAEVDRVQAKAVSDLRTSHQQNTTMLSIGMLFTEHEDAGDISSRIQWASTLYNSNSAELNRLTELQLQLQNDQANMAVLEDNARIAREAAAAHLAVTQAAEQAATDAANAVAEMVAANQAAEANAQQVLAEAQAAYNDKQAEMDSVTQRIQERNAQRAAEAAAAAAAAEAAAAAAAAAASQQSTWTPPAAPAPAANSGSGFPLYTPANGPYTSSFGWRTNPVLGYSELHDGLDIGSMCGTPLYAAADGVVTDMYYGGGWGWKLTIDNGWINGVQVSTGYNHAQGYIVSPGQWVSRGQVVGYTGTTGLSTGCHLHFHVWINGQVVNPANYL